MYACLLQLVIEQGGIQPGGLNFDAKLRRESIAIEDMFIAHIGEVAHMLARMHTPVANNAYCSSLSYRCIDLSKYIIYALNIHVALSQMLMPACVLHVQCRTACIIYC